MKVVGVREEDERTQGTGLQEVDDLLKGKDKIRLF